MLQSATWTARTTPLGRFLPSRAGGPRVGALLALLRRRREYEILITADLRTALAFALLRRLLGLRRPKHLVLEMMLDEESASPGWRFKRRLQRYAFASVDCIVVSSTMEIPVYAARLGVPAGRIRFVPFHTNVVEPVYVSGSKHYILSAGKTGRDYQTLSEAVRDIDHDVVVVSDAESVRDVSLPQRVRLVLDAPYGHYRDLLQACDLLVLPLRPLVKSTGQVALLEAMALGKPVIATRVVGTVDYVQSGLNGILVPPGNPSALREAIVGLLRDPVARERLGRAALESVRDRHTFERYARAILDIVDGLSRETGGRT